MQKFTIDQSYMIQEIVEQLEKCKFKDAHGHTLEMNIEFIRLKSIANGEINLEGQDELDEILDKLGKAVAANPNGEGPAYAYKEAKQALLDYFHKREVEARIDELEQLPRYEDMDGLEDNDVWKIFQIDIPVRLQSLNKSKGGE